MYGQKLKSIVKQSGLSQTNLADKMGVAQSTVSTWYNSIYPPLEVIEKVCAELDVPLWQFFAPDDLVIPKMTAQQGEIWRLIQDADQDMKMLFLDVITAVTKAYNLGGKS